MKARDILRNPAKDKLVRDEVVHVDDREVGPYRRDCGVDIALVGLNDLLAD